MSEIYGNQGEIAYLLDSLFHCADGGVLITEGDAIRSHRRSNQNDLLYVGRWANAFEEMCLSVVSAASGLLAGVDLPVGRRWGGAVAC